MCSVRVVDCLIREGISLYVHLKFNTKNNTEFMQFLDLDIFLSWLVSRFSLCSPELLQ